MDLTLTFRHPAGGACHLEERNGRGIAVREES